MKTVNVSTKYANYPVLIGSGLRFSTGKLLDQYLNDCSSVLIVTDDQVAPHYLDDVADSLSNKTVNHYVIEAGEPSKSLETFNEVITYALEQGLDRKSVIIALGGGVVGDLAGYVAASLFRGVRYIQMPTTVLSFDSSVGGKVAVNHPIGKNLIGAFYQPKAVIYDIDTLNTLPMKEWRSGFAEVIKHSLLFDEAFYDKLKEEITELPITDVELLMEILATCIQQKARIVEEDEKEKGVRAYLNLGHTLGHALESELGYGKLTHGEAVMIGLIFALKLQPAELDLEQLKQWVTKLGYQIAVPENLKADRLIEKMKKDKKNVDGNIRMVFIKKPGKPYTEVVAEEVIRVTLKS